MSSAIPGTVAYFLNLVKNALPSTAEIWMGQKLGVYTAPVTFQITEIVGDQEWAVLGPDYKREETFSITCQLSSYMGDQDLPTRLQEDMAIFQQLSIAIAKDPSLGGNVRLAELSKFEFLPMFDAKGQSLGTFKFEVLCQVRITTLT